MTSRISVVMGSSSDWGYMQEACKLFDQFGVEYDKKVISAHRMPQEMFDFAREAKDKGVKVIIAGAGGAAHLPGMLAANTPLPVIGCPAKTSALGGMDSLLSIVQMPAGIPVATTAIGPAGAKNAALLAMQILGLSDPDLQDKIVEYRKQMHDQAKESSADLVY